MIQTVTLEKIYDENDNLISQSESVKLTPTSSKGFDEGPYIQKVSLSLFEHLHDECSAAYRECHKEIAALIDNSGQKEIAGRVKEICESVAPWLFGALQLITAVTTPLLFFTGAAGGLLTSELGNTLFPKAPKIHLIESDMDKFKCFMVINLVFNTVLGGLTAGFALGNSIGNKRGLYQKFDQVIQDLRGKIEQIEQASW